MNKPNVINQILAELGQPVATDALKFYIEDIVKYIIADKKISAIKKYRECTGYGLKESKDFVFHLAEFKPRELHRNMEEYLGRIPNPMYIEIKKKQEFNEELL